MVYLVEWLVVFFGLGVECFLYVVEICFICWVFGDDVFVYEVVDDVVGEDECVFVDGV